MAKSSETFLLIKHELFKLLGCIPQSKVASLSNIADALNIPARHAGYIISRMENDEQDLIPWYRVIPSKCCFPAIGKRTQKQKNQILKLRMEDVLVNDSGGIRDLENCMFELPKDNAQTIWADIAGT